MFQIQKHQRLKVLAEKKYLKGDSTDFTTVSTTVYTVCEKSCIKPFMALEGVMSLAGCSEDYKFENEQKIWV